MALVKCPECGGKVSDKAVVCPHCGCPAEEIRKATDSGKAAEAVSAEDLDKSRTADTVSIKRKVPEALRTPDGKKITQMYDGPLLGTCQACDAVVEFEAFQTSTAKDDSDKNETPQDAGEKQGFFRSAFDDISKVFKGGKAAFDYRCKRCSTVYQVCPACQRPNKFRKDRQRCDYCEQILIT